MKFEILKTEYWMTLAKRKFLEDQGGSEDRSEAYASYGECGPKLTTKIFGKFTFAPVLQNG
jgi:hypothetical protein